MLAERHHQHHRHLHQLLLRLELVKHILPLSPHTLPLYLKLIKSLTHWIIQLSLQMKQASLSSRKCAGAHVVPELQVVLELVSQVSSGHSSLIQMNKQVQTTMKNR